MSDQENDFQLDVTDLSASADADTPLDENTTATAEQRGDGSPSPLIRGLSRRMRTMIVVSIVLLAVTLIVLIDPAIKSSITAMLRGPAPTPSLTLSGEANLVFLESGAPWGTFSLDGQPPTPLSQKTMRLSSVWIRLTLGHHTIQVTQPPFHPLTCRISLPADRGDTCPLVRPQTLREGYFSNQPDDLLKSRVIDLGVRFDRLSPADAAALVNTVRGYWSLSLTPSNIMPGDHYLGDDGTVAVAQMPLQGILQVASTPPDSSAPSDSAQCQSFCDMLTNWATSGNTGGLWSLSVAGKGSWHITTTGGQVIAGHAPLWPGAAPFNTLPPETRVLRMGLDINWNGAWDVSNQANSGFDGSSFREVALPMTSALLNTSPRVDTSAMGFYEGQEMNTGQGCVVTLTPRDPDDTISLNLLYRLGVLLAANDAAHRAFPGLPIATPHEQSLARSIMGQL